MKKILWMSVVLAALTACSGDDYTVYETVAPKLYVLDSEFHDLTATYEQSPGFTVHVCRSGNSTATVDVAFAVNTSALVNYNIKTDGSRQLLPQICYRIPQDEAVSSSESYRLSFDVELDAQAIRALPAGDYALPLGISSAKVAIDPEADHVILGISIR